VIGVAYLIAVGVVGYWVLGSYALGAVGFVIGLGAYCLIAGWAWDRITSATPRRHINAALTRGDEVMELYVAEAEAYANAGGRR